MMQWIELVTQSYRLARVLRAAGRGLSGSEQDEGLHILNSHIDGLKAERMLVYQVLRTQFDLNPNQQDYTVCSAAVGAENGIVPDWDIERPERIQGAGFLVPGGPPTNMSEVPMQVLLEFGQWKNIVNKDVKTSQPRVLYYRASLVAGTASVWPIPYVAGKLVIYTIGTVSEVQSITDAVMLPQGYREFLEYSLALAVAERYGTNVSASVVARATQYKARIKANEFVPILITSDPGALGRPRVDTLRWWDARTWPGGF